MGLFEENTAFLRRHRPELLQALLHADPALCRRETARNGQVTAVYLQQGQPYSLHSRYDPGAEALKLLQEKRLDGGHVVVRGIGLGYHLARIMESKPAETRVLAIEPEPAILRESLHLLPWHRWLARDDFHLFVGRELSGLSGIFPHFFRILLFDQMETIDLPSEIRLFPDFFAAAAQVVDSEIRTMLYDFKTMLLENAMVPSNILKNLPHILRSRPAAALRDRFAGAPGILVSAGPSLDKNVLQLKQVRDRAVIIAVDTALKPLLARDIQPHFTVAVDPSYKNYLHLLGTAERLTHYVLAETGVAAQLYRDMGERIFTVSIGKPLVRMLEQRTQPFGSLDAWGSVISLAADFAVFLGLDPIVFIGQDFAFTTMRGHCRHTSWEEHWQEYYAGADDVQRMERQAISGIHQTVEEADIYGHPVLTSDRLLLYKNYLVKILRGHPGRTFLNATEGGVLREIPAMPLRQVFRRHIYGRPALDFPGLRQTPVIGTAPNRQRLQEFFQEKIAFFDDYRRQMRRIAQQLAELHDPASPQAFSVMAETERVKNLLYETVENGELVEMWSQAPIYDFLRKYRTLQPQGSKEKFVREAAAIFRDYFERLLPQIERILDALTDALQAMLAESPTAD